MEMFKSILDSVFSRRRLGERWFSLPLPGLLDVVLNSGLLEVCRKDKERDGTGSIEAKEGS